MLKPKNKSNLNHYYQLKLQVIDSKKQIYNQ
jgi:hypothetical protein